MEPKKDNSKQYISVPGRNPKEVHLPNNSNAKKDAKPVPRIAQAKKVKPTLRHKFATTFLGEDVDGVSKYVFTEVVIPAMKSTLSDVVTSGIEMLLYGDTQGGRSKGNPRNKFNNGYTNYSNYSNTNSNRNGRRSLSYRDRATHNFDQLVFDTRAEADSVIGQLNDLCERYGTASVNDFYSTVGVTPDYTDVKYGWDTLQGATTRKARNGYIIILPPTIEI